MKEENKKSDHLKYVRLLYAEIEERNYKFYTFEVVTTGKLEKIRKDLLAKYKVNIYYMYNNNLNSKVNIKQLDNFINEFKFIDKILNRMYKERKQNLKEK